MTCFASSIRSLPARRLHDHSCLRWNGIGNGMEREQAGNAARPVRAAAALLAVLLASGEVDAQQSQAPSTIYSCVANGKTFSGDRPPPECANSDIRELNRDGSVRRVIPRPLTAEEQKARALEAKKRLDDEERILAQRRRDRALLEAYANEDEIEAARAKSLDTSNEI